jgi:predicted acylesterase/phospholipase RssA
MVKRQFKNLNFIFALTICTFLLNACAIKTKKVTTTTSPSAPTAPTKTNIILPPGSETSETPTTIESSDENAEVEKPKQPETSNSQVKVLPKFGIIFSGGGAKAWGHIGALKELQKLKWPISAVAGFEWGAAVAALYAQNLSVNEVEWELSKLKSFDKWDQFIKAAFPRKTTAELKIPFVCPSLNIAKQSVFLLNRGQLSQLVPFCIGSPVLTKPINQSIAVMTDVPSLAQHLRATGANRIILINVLAQNTKRSFIKDYESSDNIWWVESAGLMAKKPIGVDEIVDINLDDYGIKDIDKRRDIINKGSELSSAQFRKLAEKYGL